MSNFSKSPDQQLADAQAKGYVGVRIEQGVPILDRDLNLMGDLAISSVQSLAAAYVGDGVPVGSDAFKIIAIDGAFDFLISGGNDQLLAGGFAVKNPSTIAYSSQPGAPPITPVHVPNVRSDQVYLDAWLAEVDAATDPSLGNPNDVGVQTSVRRSVSWRVRVAEGTVAGTPPTGHTYVPLANIIFHTNTRVLRVSVFDLRTPLSTVASMQARLVALEQLVTTLAPVFASPPWPPATDRKSGSTAMEIFGRNFDLGAEPPQIAFDDGTSKTFVDGTTVTATPVGLTFRRPELTKGATYTVIVITSLGQGTASTTFTIDAA
jgi:hypothetical protein